MKYSHVGYEWLKKLSIKLYSRSRTLIWLAENENGTSYIDSCSHLRKHPQAIARC